MKVNLKENIVINNQLLPNNITNESVLKLFRLIDKASFFDEVDKSFFPKDLLKLMEENPTFYFS